MNRSVRKIELFRAGWGCALLLAPRATLTAVHRVRVDRTSVTVARILGARHLTQAALSGVDPSPEVLAMGVWVDGVHASTALALAALDTARARAGLVDVAVAALWAGAGYRDIDHAAATAPTHDRVRDEFARAVLASAPGGRRLLGAARHAREQVR